VFKHFVISAIASLIPFDLLSPPAVVRLGHRSMLSASVPEAPIYKDGYLLS
jgi:hypothetical protein